MDRKPTNWEGVRMVVVSVAIGATINILTILFQFFVEWLRTIPAEIPGTVVGVAKYLHAWKTSLHS